MHDDTSENSPDMHRPLRAHTFNEVRYYLMVSPCGSCGKGPWEIGDVGGNPGGELQGSVPARCRHCDAEREFAFSCEFDLPSRGVEAEAINPGDEPSEIIDLGQWLSLFYLLIESAASERSEPATRRDGYRASLCLEEALKFYEGDDELPPDSAFFSPRSMAARREHAENFAREKLRNMQAKLPSPGAMRRRIRRDQSIAKRRWWQFWRR